MDNLSGKANYYKSSVKKKTEASNDVEVIVDYKRLTNESIEIDDMLKVLIEKTNKLYSDFNKKELHDMLTTLGMANRDLGKLKTDLKENHNN